MTARRRTPPRIKLFIRPGLANLGTEDGSMEGYFLIHHQRVYRLIECILKVQVPGVSMRPSPCTDADDLLCCSATVGNLVKRGEPSLLR